MRSMRSRCRFDWYEETKAVADALEIPIAGGEQEPSTHNFRWLIANGGLSDCAAGYVLFWRDDSVHAGGSDGACVREAVYSAYFGDWAGICVHDALCVGDSELGGLITSSRSS